MFVGSLIPNSDFSQLKHIPDLMAHYELHLEETAQLNIDFSVWSFLKIHFVNPNGHEHEGNDSHKNCPFQSFCSPLTFVFSTSNLFFFERIAPFSLEILSYENAFYLNGFVSTEIQPPSFS
jgi:hypothetical protein